MATLNQQKKAAKEFAERWQDKGNEKQDSQRFWFDLLQSVYGIEKPADFVRFEQTVKLEHTSFIDVMIPATHTMIEQKGLKKDLNAPIKQSDGTYLKPSEQAKRYAAALPYSERPRWIISCNFRQFQVFDMERPNDEPELIELKNLEKEYYRLQFMVDVKDSHITKEMELSRDAGQLVGKIYDALLPAYGEAPSEKDLQDLNKFIVRLVFCLYAEDAGLFGKKNMFHDYLESFNPKHFRGALKELFAVLDIKEPDRDKFMEPELAAFPYVNGSLFAESIAIPPISEGARNLILGEGCDFDWSNISPTIFGAIFESTLNPATRRSGGMHYTSIENIHKVIDPLFLDEFRHKFQEAMELKTLNNRLARLKELQKEMASMRFLDPAAGSGNFLTESYLSLRRLENDILRETITDKSGTGLLGFVEDEFNPIKVSISQFYGIEINDFAVSVAKTAMWIAESQMFSETIDIINREMDFLPLTTNANIHEGNALRMDWKEVLKPSDKVRILGNPPFVGYSLRTQSQKDDIESVYIDADGKTYNNAGKVDYVAGWYYKASQYMNGNKSRSAFVSTNSICQGEQVSAVWKPLYDLWNIHIDFAYQTFVWNSESKTKAAVHCVIIGFSNATNEQMPRIYNDSIVKFTDSINPYILPFEPIFIDSRKKPICNVSEIVKGSSPVDGQNLLITEEEYDSFAKKEPGSLCYIHPFLGAKEFLQGVKRYCLWLKGVSPAKINKLPMVKERIEATRKFRLNSKKEATRKYADYPNLFMEDRQPSSMYILIPRHSSQNRRYIPMGFMTLDVICGDANNAMPNATIYDFGILESNVHMAWMRTVCGRIKSDYRYSNDVVYNNFPWPTPTDKQRDAIEKTAQAILDARAIYPDSSLADLYNELTMPKELRAAHRANDKAVMQAYGFWGKLNSESECVAELMKMYQKLCDRET